MGALSNYRPGRHWAAITPSDTDDLPTGIRQVYVGGTGDVAAVGQDDEVVTFAAVPAGAVLDIGPKRIDATGTTATDLVAIY